jgi:hypothetical protein
MISGCSSFNKYLPNNSTFPTWLYTITAGGNDILTPLENGASLALVNGTLVPQAVGAVGAAITVSKHLFIKSGKGQTVKMTLMF